MSKKVVLFPTPTGLGPATRTGWLAGCQWGRCPQQRHIPRTWPLTRGLLGTASGEWGLGPSGCEGKLGVALESLQGLRDLT